MLHRRRKKKLASARRDPALDKKALWKSIDKDQKKAAREKLAAMKARVREERRAGSAARESAKAFCKSERTGATERAKEIRAHHRAEAKKDVANEKAHARSSCTIKKHHHSSEVARLRAEVEAEKRYQREMRAIARSNRSRALATAKRSGIAKAREKTGESDDEVRSNIPPDLIHLFNRVRRSIKGTARKSRTEAFLQYVEDHPGEETRAIEDKTDALVRELERQQRAGRRDPSGVRYQVQVDHPLGWKHLGGSHTTREAAFNAAMARGYRPDEEGQDAIWRIAIVRPYGQRDKGPIRATRTFRERARASTFLRAVRRKHPEARIAKSRGRYVVAWRTKETR